MKNSIKLSTVLVTLSLTLAACAEHENYIEESCSGEACTEQSINAPLDEENSLGYVEETLLEEDMVAEPMATNYSWPSYSSSWGFPQRMYNEAKSFYSANYSKIANKRYVVIIDFNQHSSKKRFYLFDLATGKVERHNTSHGKNSDPDADGYATIFSNTNGSKKSSLGFYLTLKTYYGSHGYSMRLRGLESSNDNAEDRAIVVHPANYVDDNGYAGRSWGCPALDPDISRSVIDKIKGGSLFFIDK